MTKKTLLTLATLLLCLLASAKTDTFTTKGHRLLDASGKTFVIRGMHNPHAWFSEKAYNALDEISSRGCNTVRIVWQTRGKDEELERITRRLKLPVIVGEFGYNFSDGRNNLGCKADHTAILSTCNKLGYGFMPWSWTCNNEENQWLDLVESRDWKTLTWWGEQVIAGPGGISQTARKASVFESR